MKIHYGIGYKEAKALKNYTITEPIMAYVVGLEPEDWFAVTMAWFIASVAVVIWG